MSFVVDDLDIFFQDFGVDAVYTPQGGAASTIRVLFDNTYVAVDTAGNVLAESKSPIAHCKTSDIQGIRHGDTLLINGTTYYIVEHQPDGTGISVLVLSKDA